MPDFDVLIQELTFKAVRSSGPGGQHVNKTASKVVAHCDIPNSVALNDEEKRLLTHKLSSRLTTEGILILESSATRSQHKNKELVIERMRAVISAGLKKEKRRKKTRPPRIAALKRLLSKKQQAEKKAQRKKPDL